MAHACIVLVLEVPCVLDADKGISAKKEELTQVCFAPSKHDELSFSAHSDVSVCSSLSKTSSAS